MKVTIHNPEHVSGNSQTVVNQQTIQSNVAKWRRDRRRRQQRIEQRSTGFVNSPNVVGGAS